MPVMDSLVALVTLAVTVLGSVGFNLFMVARWTGRVEAEQKRQEDRIDRLFARDERIYERLDALVEIMQSIKQWIAREEGFRAAKDT